jgi:hypothetical protein
MPISEANGQAVSSLPMVIQLFARRTEIFICANVTCVTVSDDSIGPGAVVTGCEMASDFMAMVQYCSAMKCKYGIFVISRAIKQPRKAEAIPCIRGKELKACRFQGRRAVGR